MQDGAKEQKKEENDVPEHHNEQPEHGVSGMGGMQSSGRESLAYCIGSVVWSVVRQRQLL